MREVRVGSMIIRTTIDEVAECLEELATVLENGTAEGADIVCVFKALNYLKKYRARSSTVIEIIKRAEEIIKKDLEEGRIKLW